MRRVVLAPLLALAACGGSADPEPAAAERRLALVDERISSRQAVAVPPTARVGTPFDVAITAIVGTECARLDGADVRVDGLAATVTPYVTIDERCAGHALFEGRTFAVRFDQAGDAVVRVRVRSAEAQGAETVVVRPVRVLP